MPRVLPLENTARYLPAPPTPAIGGRTIVIGAGKADAAMAQAHEVMMVACHKYGIVAAKALGLRTAFVAQPLEVGPNGKVDVRFEDQFDINARAFLHLAEQLDC